MTLRKGLVVLAGAGPGDPGLTGGRVLQYIREADVIVYDRLVSERLLADARPDAEKIYVGKASSEHTLRQDGINALLVKLAKQGKSVLRLKGGDPFVFGRGGEEAQELHHAQVPFEIVSGVTSAIAVPAYAGIPVTHRGIATSFAVFTGHEEPGKIESSLQWDKLATATDTLVFLMGVENLPYITDRLIQNGRAATTPAAIIRWGTTTQQRTLVTTVGTAVEDVAVAGILPPAIFIVGEVVRLRNELQWFDNRPLFGKTVLVTRARAQASRFVAMLEEAGARCIEAPAIRIESPEDMAPAVRAAMNLSQYKWVIFTSANGVDRFFQLLHANGKDARAFGSVRIAAIGPETAMALKKEGLSADLVPREFRAEAILEMLEQQVAPGERVLLARALEAREVLPDELRKKGVTVDVVPVYRTVTGEADGGELLKQLQTGAVDLVTFTSSSTVTNLLEILGPDGVDALRKVTIACIGPVTADTCREVGLEPSMTATEYTIKGLTDIIIKSMGGKGHA